jgi:hypothetical protein
MRTYTDPVRRFFCCSLLVSFALSLHASVPPVKCADVRPANLSSQPAFDHTRPVLLLTAVPADVSFYEEFYPMTAVRPEQPKKTSVLHWFGNLIKKAVRR